jgi:cytoskeletal protein CcmA (bactofilin family)
MSRTYGFAIMALLAFLLSIPPSVLDAQYVPANVRSDTLEAYHHNRFGSFIDDIITRVEREMLWQLGYDDTPVVQKQKIQLDGRRGAIHFNGNVVIDQRDRIEGNVVIRNGTLTVRGAIEGDVLVLNGDAIVETGGVVTGSVTAVNGKVHQAGGTISGAVEEKEGIDVEYTYPQDRRIKNVRYRLTNYMQEDLSVRDLHLHNFYMGFNRVEGFSLGVGSRKNLFWDGEVALSLYGQVGYAFKAHRWRAMLGGTRQFPFPNNQLMEIGAEIFTLTDTKDDWVIGRTENDLAAFFVHRDYRDYYDREGFSVYAGHYMNGSVGSAHLRIQYLSERHSSMRNRTDWALFVRDRSYRENPLINEGELRAIRIGLNASTVGEISRRSAGWSLLATAELSSPGLGGDFNYNQYVLDIRRFQPVSQYDNVNIRMRVGSAEGDLPVQRSFELGGLGTLPAYRYKEFGGNRMFLVNTEYVLKGGVLDQLAFFPSGLFRGLSLLLFLDTGWVGIADESGSLFEGFDDLSVRNLNTSLGVGVGSRGGSWRLGFSWRTDRAETAVVFLRIARPF